MRATTRTRRQVRPWMVALFGFAAGALLVLRSLIPLGWDPTIFVAFGEEAEATLAYGRELLGDPDVRTKQGHDGKFFFVQGNDPWLLDPEANAMVLDRPLYRSQRMLFPMLAGGLGLFGPWGVVWGMLGVSVISMGAGTWAAAIVARGLGGSPWWGLAFGLNIGLLAEILVGGAGVLGFALGMWGVVLLDREEVIGAALVFGAAALTREALLIMAFGAAWWLVRRRQWRSAALVAAVPVVMVGIWALYLRLRLGWDSGVGQVEEIGWPFVGFWEALKIWPQYPANLLGGLMSMGILLAFLRRALFSDRLIAWATIGFVPLAFLFTFQVWFGNFDITRAIAPVITAFVLLVFARGRRRPAEAPA